MLDFSPHFFPIFMHASLVTTRTISNFRIMHDPIFCEDMMHIFSMPTTSPNMFFLGLSLLNVFFFLFWLVEGGAKLYMGVFREMVNASRQHFSISVEGN